MSQKTVASDADGEQNYDEIREEMMTTKGVERSTLDMGDEDHALSGMDSKRKAPVEAVAKNVVDRYDDIAAFLREYMANAHTACIQRAKWELKQAGVSDVDYNDVREVLERAKEEVGYEPVITVVRNQNEEDFALKIKDNGIGIASQTAYAIRDIGLSGWHDDGTTNGQFGQGTMAGFLPVDHWGEFDMTTWSAISGENYRARWKLTDLDKLPGERERVGTTFTWPYFTDEAQDIDTYEKVREFAEGMIVPVIYEHYDEDGRQDGEKSDDWGASYIEDRYADDSPLIVYEDDYAKVVWSPDDPEGWSTNLKTWCGYQPIDRNDSGFGINSYSMPSGFDVRVKVENGPIVHVPDDGDQSLVGKIPVSKNRYEHLPDEQTDEHVIRSDMPEGTIVAPEPTDDRDRFESKHVSDFMRHYAGRLEQQFKDRVAEIIEDLDGLESLPDMDDVDRRLLLTGIDEYISVYAKNDAERLQDDIEEEFGVRPDATLAVNIGVVKSEFGDSVSDDFAKAVGRMKQATLGDTSNAPMDVDDADDYFAKTVSGMTDKVSWASRNTRKPGQASNRTDKPVWDVLEEAGDDGTVFMAKTLGCERKARLAWELHEDNQVVVVSRYEKWADMYDWEKVKDLPSRNFADHFEDHDFDDDWLDTWDPSVGDSGAGPSTTDGDVDGLSYDDKRAARKAVKVRYNTGHGKYDTVRGEDLFDALDDDGTFSIGYKSFDTLLLYRQTDGHSASVGKNLADKSRGIAYAVVPNYVYDYLIKTENGITEQQYKDRQRETWVDFDWSAGFKSGDEIGNLDERDVFIAASDDLLDPIHERDLMDDFVDALEGRLDGYDIDGVDSITFVSDIEPYKEVLHKRGCIDTNAAQDDTPTLVKVKTNGFGGNASFGYGYATTLTLRVSDVYFDCVLPDLDRDAVEWSHFDPTMDDDALIDALQDLEDAGGFVSTDDTDLPEHVGEGKYCISPSRYYVEQTMARFADATDYLDCEGDA